MRRLLALVMALSIALMPLPLSAQDEPETLVPKLVLSDCAPDFKCLDLEGYRQYLLMRAHYQDLFNWKKGVPGLVSQLKIAAEQFEKASETNAARADRSEKAYDELFPKYIQQVQATEKAKRMSIFGGALPWLLTIGAVCLSAGIGIGVWAATKLSQ